MANRQTKALKKLNISCVAARGAGNTEPSFKSYPAGSQPSQRNIKWGLKLPENKERVIVYPEEFKNRVKFRK